MKMYKTGEQGQPIEEVEVSRVTDLNVWVYCPIKKEDVKIQRKNRHWKYWGLKQDAKNFLIKKYKKDVIRHNNNVFIAKGRLKEAEQM